MLELDIEETCKDVPWIVKCLLWRVDPNEDSLPNVNELVYDLEPLRTGRPRGQDRQGKGDCPSQKRLGTFGPTRLIDITVTLTMPRDVGAAHQGSGQTRNIQKRGTSCSDQTASFLFDEKSSFDRNVTMSIL